MKRVLFWIYLMIKKQISNPFIVCLLIAIPLATLIAKNIPAMNKTDKLRVGICLTDNDETVKDTTEKLVNGNYPVEFYYCPSREDLVNDIMNKKAECGYVFGSNLQKRLLDGEIEGLMECVINESNYVSSMTNEIVFATLFKESADDILEKFIRTESTFSKATERSLEIAKYRYEKYLEGDETFHLDFKVIDTNNDGSATRQIDQRAGKFPLKAVLTILVFVSGLFGVAWFIEDENKGTYATLSKGYKILGKPVYAFIGAILFWFSSTLALIISGENIGIKEVLIGIFYVVLVTIYAWILGLIFRKLNLFIGVSLVLLIACFIFCHVFMNISLYLPSAKYIRAILLPNYFI